MIDTGKYKGHTRGPWYPHNQDHHGEIMIKVSDDNWKSIGQMRTTADKLLAADAPLLLAEVKRLREESDKMRELLLRGVKLMNNASKTTDEGNDYFAESFEDAVMEVIE